MSAHAVVLETHADGSVDLEFASPKRCVGCAGVCFWRSIGPTTIRHVSMPNPSQATLEPGAAVVMNLPDRVLLRGSLLLHGIPLAAILGGALAGAQLTQSDWGALAGAVIAIAMGLRITSLIRDRIERATLAELNLKVI